MSVTHRAKMGVSNHTERKAALGSGTSSWNHTDLHIAGLSGKCHSRSGPPHTDSISPLLSGPSCLPCPGDRWLYSVLLAAPTNSQAFGDLKELRFTLHCCGSQKHSMSFTRWKSGPWSGQAGPDLKEALAENHFLALSSALRHSVLLSLPLPLQTQLWPSPHLSAVSESLSVRRISRYFTLVRMLVVTLQCAWIIQDNLLNSGSLSEP